MAIRTLDPITTEIVRSAFSAAADEMNATLIRSAYTPIIYEMKDCSVALLDAEHRVLGQSAGLPIFLGNLEICTRITEEMYGRDGWEPGDVWIMNDSYMTGTHLNDMTAFGPIFVEGELAGFAACRAHWLDVGAKDPGGPMDSTEIYQEGIRLGPLKVVEHGRQRRDVTDLLGRNSRFGYPAVGDLGAQIACVRTGQRRLEAIVAKYGRDTLEAARDEIFAQTERLERAAVAAVPDGVYRAEGCIDNDGTGDEPVWVRVAVHIAGEEMTIDVSESDDARYGPINCGEAQAISACRVAYKLLINPDNPPNGGAFRPLSVNVRRGSVLGAEEPYPCQWYFTPLGLLIDLVVKALADVLPEQAAGASYGDSMIIGIAGVDHRHGRPFFDLEPTVGGWGAWQGSDGEDGLINNVNGSLKDLPIEVLETKFPMRMTQYGFRADSGGAGRWRGGNGVIREYTIDCEQAQLFLWFERSKTPAWGLFGGRDATPPTVVLNPGSDGERQMLKASRVSLRRGDVIRTMTGGGGGYGNPSERDPDSVRADVRSGQVTAAAAREVYGVDVGNVKTGWGGMNRKRIWRSATIALAVSVVAAGCGSSNSSSSSASSSASAGGTQSAAASGCGGSKVKNVAFFGFAASNSFAQATWKGVQAEAKACGASAKFFDPNFNAQTQVNQMEDAITTGQYQVFVVQANDGLAVVPAVKRAIQQGITVVGEFTQIGSNYATIQPQVPGLIFVGESSVQNGHALGQLGIEACKGVNPCQVAYLQGSKALPLDNARTAAVMQTLKTASNVQLVASPEGGYTPSTGLAATQDVLSAHPNVNVIIGSSQAIEGAQLALKRANKLGKIKLIGNGGSCQAVAGVLSGKWFASYIVAEKSDGQIATKFGIQAANGKKVPHSYNIDQLQDPLGTKQVIEKSHFKAQYCD